MLRDQLVSVRKAIERQQMVDAKEEDYDVIGIAEDPLEASVQVFFVRKGRVVGRKGLVVDKVEDVDAAELVGRLLEQLYGGARSPTTSRARCSSPTSPRTSRSTRSSSPSARGAKVRRPGAAARRQARAARRRSRRTREEAFVRHKLRRASDHNARARALLALQEALDLPEAPLRIECFDISNLQGTEIVGVDGGDGGRPAEALRLPPLQGPPPGRAGRLRRDGGGARPAASVATSTSATRARAPGKRFAYPPNLLLVDGGKGQLGVAVRVLEELGLEDIAVASLAKRFEEVYLPGDREPVRIPRDSEALYLLQQVRDEAHRFAITYHRQLRDKKMTRSVLDDVPGLGPIRRARLLQGVRLGEAAARADRGRARRDPVAARRRSGARGVRRSSHGDLRARR